MGARLVESELRTRVAAVLAEAVGVDESRSFDEQAVALAKTMRNVRHDWAGKPTITWDMAAELLASLRAERARVAAEAEARAIAADEVRRAAVPKGVPWDAVPVGIDPGQWLMLNDREAQRSRRESVLEHALAHRDGQAIYHPIREDAP